MSDDLDRTACPPGGVLIPDCVLRPADLDTAAGGGTCPTASEVGGDGGGLGRPGKPKGPPNAGPPGNIKPEINSNSHIRMYIDH